MDGRLKRKPSPIIPVTVLTGFLGSGKTTLLNRILNDSTHKMKFAVIENEFGDVGIDEKIISENVEEEMIQVLNGCICCTVRGDLIKALKKLYERVEAFDGIIIESTGMADPAPIAQIFYVDEELQKMYKLDSVITVADAKHIIQYLNEKKVEGVEHEAAEQVAFADKIILNKVDLVKNNEEELVQIEKRLRSLNPTAPILRCQHSNIDPKELLNIKAFDLSRALIVDPKFLDEDQEHQHDSTVTAVASIVEGDINVDMLTNWIEQLVADMGPTLYRYKGMVAVQGKAKKFLFQGVGMFCDGNYQGLWKKREKRESRFVFIGKDLDTDLLKSGFQACVANKALRFKVGASVMANCGKFKKGKVIKVLDDGNAYQIKLGNGKKIWAPLDIDQYVRAA